MAVISLNRHCPLVPPLLIFFTETLCCQKTAPFHWLSAQCSTVRSGMSRRHFGKKKQLWGRRSCGRLISLRRESPRPSGNRGMTLTFPPLGSSSVSVALLILGRRPLEWPVLTLALVFSGSRTPDHLDVTWTGSEAAALGLMVHAVEKLAGDSDVPWRPRKAASEYSAESFALKKLQSPFHDPLFFCAESV